MVYQFCLKKRKLEKLVANLHDETEYVIYVSDLKQALNHGIVFKKVHGIINFNRNAWLKPYINMNTTLKKLHRVIKFIQNAWLKPYNWGHVL